MHVFVVYGKSIRTWSMYMKLFSLVKIVRLRTLYIYLGSAAEVVMRVRTAEELRLYCYVQGLKAGSFPIESHTLWYHYIHSTALVRSSAIYTTDGEGVLSREYRSRRMDL